MEYEPSYGADKFRGRKFKRGQRVKLDTGTRAALAEMLGVAITTDVVGTVEDFSAFWGYKFVPEFAPFRGREGYWNIDEANLVAVEENEAPSVAFPRKPRVGDKVRLTAKGLEYFRDYLGLSDFYVGLLGEVVAEGNEYYGVFVEFPDVARPRYGFAEGWGVALDDIELIDTPAIERAYPAPRNTTVDEAKLGDDRPAMNGEEFELTMLAHFDESDAGRLLSLAATWALFPAQANQAIDLGLFAQRILRRLDGQAA